MIFPVHENRVCAKTVAQAVVQSARVWRAVISSVTNEDARHSKDYLRLYRGHPGEFTMEVVFPERAES